MYIRGMSEQSSRETQEALERIRKELEETTPAQPPVVPEEQVPTYVMPEEHTQVTPEQALQDLEEAGRKRKEAERKQMN